MTNDEPMSNDETNDAVRGLSDEGLYELLEKAQRTAASLEPIRWHSEEAAHAAGRTVYLYGLLAKEAARRAGDDLDNVAQLLDLDDE